MFKAPLLPNKAMKETKFIVLRGPSGAGKSSVAKEVRLKFLENGRKMAYVEQDYFRRIVLKEKDISGGFNIELIKKTALFLLENQYDVIMEGIFVKSRYEKMFEEIMEIHPANNFFFYFDISLKETFKRHATKPNKDDFGKKELIAWYKNKDFLGCTKEEIIPENSNLEDTVDFIFSQSRSLFDI